MRHPIFKLLVLLVLICLYGCKSIKTKGIFQNQSFNPSFDLMSIKSDSLDNWSTLPLGIDANYARYHSKDGSFLSGTTIENQKSSCDAFLIQRHFYLPIHSKEMELNLKGMIYGINGHSNDHESRLIVKQFSNGHYVQNDSMVLSNSDTLYTNKMIIRLKDYCSDVLVSIESNQSCGFLFDKISINIDDRPIQELCSTHLKSFNFANKSELNKLVSDTLKLPLSASIIGIGESMHGSKTLNLESYKMILSAIRSNQMDVLLLEISPIYGVMLNRYITNIDNSLAFDSIYNVGYLSNEYFIDLLNEIRKINKFRADPIQIAGFDIVLPLGNYISSLKLTKKYFPEQMNISDNEVVKFLNISLIKNLKDTIKADYDNEYKMKDSKFWSDLSFSQICNFNLFFSIPKDIEYRDSMMFINAHRVIEYFGAQKKYVVCAHLGHLIKSSEYGQLGSSLPMGYYLNQLYNKKYYLIGQFVGNGYYLARGYKKDYKVISKDTINKLSPPIENSIESFCNKIDKDVFYFSNWKTNNNYPAFRARFLGTLKSDIEYNPFSLDYIDAVFFNHYSDPISLLINQ
jgi:erythromycin esterase-like protein